MNADTPIEFIKNIGSERAKYINQTLGIKTVNDFVNYYPYKYIDKTKIYTIDELQENMPEIQLKGIIVNIKQIGEKQKRLVATFKDQTGSIELVWFKYSKWMVEQIPVNKKIIIFGKVNKFANSYNMPHPEIELEEKKTNSQTLYPVYSSSEKLTKRGVSQQVLARTIKNITEQMPLWIQENLPEYLTKKYKLIPKKEALTKIHFPKNTEEIEQANRRIKFEEAFFFQLSYAIKKQNHKRNAIGNPFPIVGEHFHDFYKNHIPFQLTAAQKKVLKEIRNDMKKPIQMNRLLQGDVGSGKTMVALLSMLIAIDNRYQTCLMAPTEILAQQHYISIAEMLKNTNISIELITGSTPKKEKQNIYERLITGEINIIIGTHALLEDTVKFKNLGLAIIDEQHRFGVIQRSKLWAKNNTPPHILIMTATPIPRTLAMSLYSDLEVSIIDQLPAGRKPIITAHRKESDKDNIMSFCKEEINKGRQIYFVYPLIEESETLDYKNLTDAYQNITQYFGKEIVTMLHGKMTPAEKEQIMKKFANGEYKIMVATTVIEVGVNVPNASVMIIESAEKFGLAQLHQLRGRVGRGAEQSYCILITKNTISQDGRKRIKTMVQTNDGFKISEVDMEIRGPGNILGTQQSGVLDFKKLNIMADTEIIKTAKHAVDKILEKDPLLTHPDNKSIKQYYKAYIQQKNKYSRIS